VSKLWDVVILGCGQLGGNLKTQLEQQKYQVLGVRRTKVANDSTYLSLDLDSPDAWDVLASLPIHSNAVIVGIVTPDQRTPEGYRKRYVGVAERLRQLASLPGRCHPVVWVSSTAVYADDQYGELDEEVPCHPTSWRGQIVREAELAIEAITVPKTIIRYTGLYSAHSLARLLDPKFKDQINPRTVSNRMHREDAVCWLRFLIEALANGRPTPPLIHGVDTCSVTYDTLFARLNGTLDTLVPATEGRVIRSRYRDLMPALQYPSLDSVLGTN